MDYGRFNYVAQPGDGARLIPIIGPYDEFAVEWGYREFPDAKTYEQEKKELEKITARQIEDAKLRFGDPNPREDPSQQTEDLGSDPIRATELGLKNIDRVAGYLVKATSKAGENYDLLRDLYDQLLGQRNRELGHVANVVGGFVHTNFWYPEGKKVFTPVPADQQKKAVAFLDRARLPHAALADRPGHPRPARVARHRRADPLGPADAAAEPRQQDPAGPDERAGGPGAQGRLYPGRPDQGPARGDLVRAEGESDRDRPLPPQPPARYVNLLAGFLDNPSEDSDLPALARSELEGLSKEIKALFDASRPTVSPVVPRTCRTSRPAPTTRWTRSRRRPRRSGRRSGCRSAAGERTVPVRAERASAIEGPN